MTTIAHYHKCIRKTTAAFASLFNNIILIRENKNGTENQRMIVPLEFADKEKYVKRFQGDPNLEDKIQITLPRMSYQLNGFSYDSNRKLNTNNKNFAQSPSGNDKVFQQYNPVPYDFNFSLTIYTRNIEDGNQILEQIIPYFTPDYTLRVNLIPEMNMVKNLPIVLNSVEPLIDSDGLYNTEVRTVFYTLNFTIKGFIFGAIKDVPVIKTANTNFLSTGVQSGFTSGQNSGPCCEGNISKGYLVSPGGYGDYKRNEIVYQGINYDNSYASGKVYEWNNSANTILITDICGQFKLNQPIVGTDTYSIHVPISPTPNTIIDLKITTTPNPNTATANSYWTTNTKLSFYPNT